MKRPSRGILRSGSVGLAAVLAVTLALGATPVLADEPIVLADEPVVGEEQYRPGLHFSPERNWMNDPNGLIYHDGLYHMYYQYNPNGNGHGYMSWGHATSTDLVQWTEHDVAIMWEPNEHIFSGSAVLDQNNTSGFGTAENPPIVAIYTSSYRNHPVHGNKQAQSLAYSTDGGFTFTKYAGNPVLDRNSGNFRDPKVFWYDGGSPESSYWVLVAVEALDYKVVLYKSSNLKDWEFLSEFGNANAVGGIWECPDLFELAIRDEDGVETGRSKWVMFVNLNPGAIAGGSGGQYFVGEFDGTTFTSETTVTEASVPEGELVVSGADFEGSDYAGWIPTNRGPGNGAFGNRPASGRIGGQQQVTGFQGNGVVNSFFDSTDQSTGTLESPAFTIDGKFISFLVGGGNHPHSPDARINNDPPAGQLLWNGFEPLTPGMVPSLVNDFGWTLAGDFVGGEVPTKKGSNNGSFGEFKTNSYEAGPNRDANVGTMTSPEFDITGDFISMVTAGGNRTTGNLEIQLVVDGNVVNKVYGSGTGDFTWRSMDVSAYKGQRGQLRLWDQDTGSSITFDHVVMGDEPMKPLSDETSVNLVVDGKVVRTATGANSEALRWESWNVDALRGRQAKIVIVDNHTGNWGHVLADHFIYTERTPRTLMEEYLWLDWGRDYYATVSYSNVPDGKRIVTGWMNNWQYAGATPTSPWRSSMNLPREVWLVESGTRSGQPAYEMKQKVVDQVNDYLLEDQAINVPVGEIVPGNRVVTDSSTEMYLLEAEIDMGTATRAGLLIRASDGFAPTAAASAEGSEGTVIAYSRSSGNLSVDRTRSGNTEFSQYFPSMSVAPVYDNSGVVKFKVYIDRTSVELFAEDGFKTISDLIYPSPTSQNVSVFAEGGTAHLNSLKITPMRPSMFAGDTRVTPREPVLDADGTLKIPSVAGIEYAVRVDGVVSVPVNGKVSLMPGQKAEVSAEAIEGYVIAEGAVSAWSFEFFKSVTPLAPALSPQGVLTVPSVEGVEYTVLVDGTAAVPIFGKVPLVSGQKAEVTAAATNGFVLAGEAQTSWSFEFIKPSFGGEPYRQGFHYSPEKNWMNDPNGLIYHDGLYHMYYQYNPNGNDHGYMSWGHATSPDLMNWTEHDVAIMWEEHERIFSGSAVFDVNNTSGLGTADNPPIVAIYTSAYRGHPDHQVNGQNKQAQSLAYSLDGGFTFTKYSGNPVLDRNSTSFRDPKVFWYDGGSPETSYWVLLAVEAADKKIVIYKSDNLKDWDYLSEFGPANSAVGVWECPDMFELPIKDANGNDTGETKWVIYISMYAGGISSGSAGQYFIGEFDGTTFISETTITEAQIPDGTSIVQGSDFEGADYQGWVATNLNTTGAHPFGEAPATGKIGGQQAVTGFLDNGLVNSYLGGDAARGILESPAFTIDDDVISFLVGGGNHPHDPERGIEVIPPKGELLWNGFEEVVPGQFRSVVDQWGWELTGDFTNLTQAPTKLGGGNRIGLYTLNSYEVVGSHVPNKNDGKGTMTSPEFELTDDFISMLVVGGARSDGTLEIQTLVDGQVVASITGPNSNTFTWKSMDVSAYRGQKARLRLVDFADRDSGSRPSITIDHVIMGKQVKPASTEETVNLVVDNQVVRTATGANSEALRWESWNVENLRGKQAKIRIIDANGGGWGHILADHFIYTDSTPRSLPEQYLWGDWGRDYYATVSYNDVPDGKRIVTGWMNNWQYAGATPTSPWRSAMNLPREVWIEQTGLRGGEPIFEMKQKVVDQFNDYLLQDLAINAPAGEIASGQRLITDASTEMFLLEAEIDMGTADRAGLTIRASEGFAPTAAESAADSEGTVIAYSRNSGRLSVDRIRSGNVSFSSFFPSMSVMPVKSEDGVVKFKAYVDRTSVELFAEDGFKTISDLIFPSPTSQNVSVFAEGGTAHLNSLKITPVHPSMFAPDRPAIPAAPVLAADGTLTVPVVEGLEYTVVVDGEVVAPVDGKVVLTPGQKAEITATATEGYAIPDGSKSSWTFEYTRTATPENPVLGAYGVLTIPAVEGVEYAVAVDGSAVVPVDGRVVLLPGQEAAITASVTPGYVLAEGADTSWNFEYIKTVGPAAPALGADGVLTVPSVEGVVYRVVIGGLEGSPETGQVTLAPGQSAVVTASPAPGYKFEEGVVKSWSFSNVKEATPVAPVLSEDGVLTVPAVTGVSYEVRVNGQLTVVSSGPLQLVPGASVAVTAVPGVGVVFLDGAQTSWTFNYIRVVTPRASTMDSEGIVFVPAVEGVAYTVTVGGEVVVPVDGRVTLAPGQSAVVTAAPAAGYTFSDGAVVSWSHSFTKAVVPVAPVFADGVITILNVNGVNYKVLVGGKEVLPVGGKVSLAPGQSAVVMVSAVTGYRLVDGATTSWDFAVPPTPNPVVTPLASVMDAAGVVSIPVVEGVIYAVAVEGSPVVPVGGKVALQPGQKAVVTASAAVGFDFPVDAATSWTHEYIKVITPSASSMDEAGRITVPVVQGVTYVVRVDGDVVAPVAGKVALVPGQSAVVMATAQVGYKLADGADSTWSHRYIATVTPVPPAMAVDGILTLPSVTGVIYEVLVGGKLTDIVSGTLQLAAGETAVVTARPTAGYTLAVGASSSWTFTLTKTVTPRASTMDSDGVVLVPQIPGVAYTVTVGGEVVVPVDGRVTLAPGQAAVVTAAPAAGYVFADGAVVSWSHSFTKTVVPVAPIFGGGVVTLPAVAGVSYTVLIDGKEVLPVGGKVSLAPGQSAVVTASALTGYRFAVAATTSWDFAVPPTPNPVVTPLASVMDAAGVVLIPVVQGVIYAVAVEGSPVVPVGGKVALQPGQKAVVTASAAAGFDFPTGAVTSWIHEFTKTVTPSASSMDEAGRITVPSVEGIRYLVFAGAKIVEPTDGKVQLAPGQTGLVMAVPLTGYKFADGASASWSHEYVAIAVPQAPVFTGGTLSLPTIEGVIYEVRLDGQLSVMVSGDMQVPQGSTALVTAKPNMGYKFSDGVATSWSYYMPRTVAPIEPSLSEEGVLTVPSIDGVRYTVKVNDRTVAVVGGIVQLESEDSAVVTAAPLAGYEFAEETQTSWRFEYVKDTPSPELIVERLAGNSRYATNLAVNVESMRVGKPVFVATGANFADALSVAPAVAALDGSLILTSKLKMDEDLVALIKANTPSAIYVIGGPGAISEAVIDQLNAATGQDPERVFGSSRYETSAAILTKFFADRDIGGAFVATGRSFPDALVASAAGGALDMPVVLVDGKRDTALSRTISQLLASKTDNVQIVGGTGAVNPAFETAMTEAGFSVGRLAGANRYYTGMVVNSYISTRSPQVDVTGVWLATGTNFPDALSASVPAGDASQRLVLSNKNCIPKPVVSEWIKGAASKVTKVTLVGGTGALSDKVLELTECD